MTDHRRLAEELAEHAARLARRIEALEDQSVLIAHDLKSILLSAMDADEPRDIVKRALDLVDSILEAARADQTDRNHTPVRDCVDQAAADLGGLPAEVVTSVDGDFPMSAAALRLVLRNLLGNAVAAGAQRIHIRARACGDRSVLIVDNDGARLGSTDRYATGAQLGLALCRRLVARCGGVLELKPGPIRGTRAEVFLGTSTG
ncbi:MAG TPA: HAMP domain-containing sensor histidine kinase [Kribbella sp.]|nr:HAMP domain-containing sensor histidine kinase [Kribbella sp.]